MTLLSTKFSEFVGELTLNGDVTLGNNPIANAFGITTNTGIPAWFSLHSANPGATGANEATAAEYTNYARTSVPRNPTAPVPWIKTTGSGFVTFKNRNSIQWVASSGGTGKTYTHWGAWDAVTGGDFMFGGPMIVSGATWKGGYVVPGALTVVQSKSHALVATNTVRCYSVYDGNLLAPNTDPDGLQKELVAPVNADDFAVTVAFVSGGNMAFIRDSSIAVTTGSVPNAPASSLLALRVC